MHRHFRRSSLFPLLLILLVIVHSSLWATVDGTLSSSDIQVTNLKLQPSRPDNVYFSLRGSTFVLNCTTVVSNVQAFNLTWQHDGERLFSEAQQVDSSTVQLKLSNTTTTDNGVYWCGPLFISNKSQGVNISLIVADPPSPPRNLKLSVMGAMSLFREYRVSWSASSYTGGLPVNYSIKLCLNDSYADNNHACKWSNSSACQPVNVFSTTKHFNCVLQKYQDFISPCGIFCNYTISVVATNDVGSATSWAYMPFIPQISATPFPPVHFNVATTGNDNELRVSWKRRNSWKYFPTEYTILYHAKNAMANETKIITNKTEFTLLKALKAFMDYYVYLMVRFVNGNEVSAHSEVLGPRIIKTPPGDPGTPPKVIRVQSVRFPGNAALRNVTVDWELADTLSWHGTPDKYIVNCNHHRRSLGSLPNCEYHVDAMTNRTVLQGLNSADRYNVYITMCNKQKGCSVHGESYLIKELEDNTTLSNNGGQLSSKQIAFITVSVVVGCITALFALYVLRKWRRGEIRTPPFRLINRIQLDPPAIHGYEYVDHVEQNDYDRLYLDEEQV